MTKIGIIIGSIREEAESARIGKVVEKQLKLLERPVEVDVFSLRDLNVPLWTEDKWEKESQMVADWRPISERLKACKGFVVISPEWAGMVPAHLKNFLLMCDGGELAHKPAQIVGVSSGMGGAYPVAELRMSGYKNNFITWLPDHIILRHVTKLFVDSVPSDLDQELLKRFQYSLRFLVETAIVMEDVRDRCQDLKTYKNGM
ncbi:NAD(P)H-dependent oxidoreductase [Sneathiella glossodoripedis]|uniref:NAD(P)H-dependent oxidoreductase n=1 Tax=Sneathiella glossodoripedis TaxID=418853 RepID=UPI00046E98E9|nr:NAD(P)H-dependent oxidoreductase [Sneathiella glossodoripedis]